MLFIVASLFMVPVLADENINPDQSEGAIAAEQKAKRTILLYDCGSNLESGGGMASYNLRQILASSFSKDDNVRFIVMTGGSYQWQLESGYLCDPYGKGISVNDEGEYIISAEYNQIWEAKGIDAAENPGKLVLLDADGITGDAESACRSEEELMITPDNLKDFINYAAENFPAEKYGLILWDHGMGPIGGFGGDEHDGAGGMASMSAGELIEVFADNAVTKDGGKFDFLNFDACLMSSIELILPFSQYTDYYIASPELVPGYGQYYGPCEGAYRGWLDELGKDPDMDTFEIGKILVDDFITFYDKEEGDGSSQEGTFSVIDMDKLINYYGLIGNLKNLFNIMDRQLTEMNDKGMYPFYDELSAWKDAIEYGKGKYNYYDLGCLISKLAMEYKELEPEDVISDEEIDYANNYMEMSAILNWILHNDTTVYGRGTKGIRSVPQYYRDPDGRIVYGELPTSGVYISFIPSTVPDSYTTYQWQIQEILNVLPDGEIKDVLNQYTKVLAKFALISNMGDTVAKMVADGYDKAGINIDTVRDYSTNPELIFYDPDEGLIDITDWNLHVKSLINILVEAGDDEEAILVWLDGIIRQQAEEAVSKKNIRVLPGNGGSGYEVKIADTRKRVIDRVQTNIIAELPSVAAYLNDPENADIAPMLNWSPKNTEFPIGIVEGKQIYGAGDPATATAEEYVQWYLDPNSDWHLDPFEEKWYAVQDADGTYHVVSPKVDEEGDEAYFLVMYHDENGNEKLAYLDFIGGTLNEIYLFTDTGGYRSFLAKDMIGELTVTPIVEVDYFMGATANIPISLNSFTITADNADQIHFVYTDIGNIPDIADTDGDGDVLTRRTVVTDIYGYQNDITDLMPVSATKSITDTEVSGIEDKVYTGSEITQVPVIMDGDTILTEGQDYELSYENNINAGTATMIITGTGKYSDTATMTFRINKALSTISIDPKEVRFSGKAVNYQKKEAKMTGSSGEVTFVYYSDPECTKAINAEDVKKAGTYYVKAIVEADANYEGAVSEAVRLTILPANQPATETPAAESVPTGAPGKSGQNSVPTGAPGKSGQNTAPTSVPGKSGQNSAPAAASGENSQKSASSAAKTGDGSNIFLWIVLMAGAVLTAGASGFVRRRKED